MKKITLLFAFLVMPSLGVAQVMLELYNDFEDGTLENWTNADGSETQLTIEDFPDPQSPWQEDLKILKKICDGTATPVGEMAIVKQFPEPMLLDIACDDDSGIDCFSNIDLHMRNANDFPLNLKLGFKDVLGQRIVMEASFETEVPPLAGWDEYFGLYAEVTHYLDGPDAFDYTQVVEVKIFHSTSPTPTYVGDYVVGDLEIDYIFPVYLLGTEDHTSIIAAPAPNPTNGKLILKSLNTEPIYYKLYGLSGRLIQEGTSLDNREHTIDLSQLADGVYLIEVAAGSQREVHKIVKSRY
ncbi:MAG: T9SS type A sorting domain-containing protein [Flavobacteriaceae bacterium]|nr:T9SS type A sorting domain-containing protein [Flavobacteriaceae bacterium]